MINKCSTDENKVPKIDEAIEQQSLDNRYIHLWGGVDDESAERIVKRLMYLEAKDPGKDITLFINSPGGVISSGLAILDAMNAITSDVVTICMGQAASMGAILLTAGAKGKRYCWPNARIMIHQPLISGQIFAAAHDLSIQAEEIVRIRERLNKILADTSGQSIEKVEEDTDRDYFMSADEGKAYGIVDGVLDTLTA